MIVLTARDQQRAPGGIVCIHFSLRARESSRCGLEQGTAWGGYQPPFVKLFCFRLGKHIGKAVLKLFERERYGFFKIEWVAQHRERSPERRERQLPYSLDRGRIDGDTCDGDAPSQNDLCKKTTERMADHDGRCG